MEAAADNGVLSIGVDSDQYATMKGEQPTTAACIITSSLKEVGKSLRTMIEKKIDGTLEHTGDREWFGGEYCGIAENENYEALTTEEIRAAVADGSIVVPSAYDMTEEQLVEYEK